MKPKVENICDNCGSKLIQRKDDTEETIRTRLKVYKEQTLPLRDYYYSKNLLKNIDGSKPIKESSAEVLNLVKNNA